MDIIPLLSSDLIIELDKLYPEKCPDPNATERQIWMAVGQRRLVRMLLSKMEYTERIGKEGDS